MSSKTAEKKAAALAAAAQGTRNIASFFGGGAAKPKPAAAAAAATGDSNSSAKAADGTSAGEATKSKEQPDKTAAADAKVEQTPTKSAPAPEKKAARKADDSEEEDPQPRRKLKKLRKVEDDDEDADEEMKAERPTPPPAAEEAAEEPAKPAAAQAKPAASSFFAPRPKSSPQKPTAKSESAEPAPKPAETKTKKEKEEAPAKPTSKPAEPKSKKEKEEAGAKKAGEPAKKKAKKEEEKAKEEEEEEEKAAAKDEEDELDGEGSETDESGGEEEDEGKAAGTQGGTAAAGGERKKGKKKGDSSQTHKCLELPSTEYDVLGAATWKPGEEVPFMFFADACKAMSGQTKRTDNVHVVANALRTVLVTTPEDLLPFLYLAFRKLAPAHEGIELGVGEATILKAVAEATGREPAKIKDDFTRLGDLGEVAEISRKSQGQLKGFGLKRKPLTVRGVFKEFKTIAVESGKNAMKSRIERMKRLMVNSLDHEITFICRFLNGNLRVHFAQNSVLMALAMALALTPVPPADKPVPLSDRVLDIRKGADRVSRDAAQAQADEMFVTLRAVFSELPSLDHIVGVVLKYGSAPAGLREHCFLQPGLPVSPMLAKPTTGFEEVLERFDGKGEFTCEFKYDGERAQVHCLNAGERVEVFSRNAQRTTTKFADLGPIVKRAMKEGVRGFVLDAEVCAWDRETKQIRPFQDLSKLKRKESTAAAGPPQVNVCLFAFDLLYIDGRSLLKEPLRKRRDILREFFAEVEGEFAYAKHVDTDNVEDIQAFMEQATTNSCEGLMVKTLDNDATYEPDRRSYKWLKIKKDYIKGLTDTVDLVPIGAFFGKGKRTGTYGAYLLAIYDPDREEYQTVCKIGTGFSDEFLASSTEALKSKVIDGPRSYYSWTEDPRIAPDVWFEPAQVWECLAADLSISPVHTAARGRVDPDKGIALRFPRFVRIRDDKAPEQSTDASQIADMYENQAVVRSNRRNRGGFD
eukprot:tig00000754_g3915.t1